MSQITEWKLIPNPPPFFLWPALCPPQTRGRRQNPGEASYLSFAYYPSNVNLVAKSTLWKIWIPLLFPMIFMTSFNSSAWLQWFLFFELIGRLWKDLILFYLMADALFLKLGEKFWLVAEAFGQSSLWHLKNYIDLRKQHHVTGLWLS